MLVWHLNTAFISPFKLFFFVSLFPLKENQQRERVVGFDVEIEDNNERKTGLRRRDTPYYKKNKRIIKDDQSRDKVLEILAQIAAKKEGGDGQVIHTEVTVHTILPMAVRPTGLTSHIFWIQLKN